MKPFFLCFFVLLLFSCGKDDIPHSVDSSLESYLDRFLAEAAKRGKTLDINKEGGVIMEFADLEPPVIGLCYHLLPIRIQIDRTYWKETADAPNRENLREDVVFHELAHGFLGRAHINDSLPNNEWASMMCGEPQVNGRNWAVNFNGYRKSYYLDELFDMNTSVPDWSYPASFDGDKGILIESDDYSSHPSDIRQQGVFTIKTGNGTCEISSSDSKNVLFSLYDTKIATDFYMEVEMYVSSIPDGGISGIFSGCKSSSEESHNYFSVSSGNRSRASNTKCIVPFAEVLVSDKYRNGTYNKLALSKRGEELFFYINDELVYRNDYQLPEYNKFGIIIPAMGSVSMRNYAVYSGQNPSVLKAGKAIGDDDDAYRISVRETNYRR